MRIGPLKLHFSTQEHEGTDGWFLGQTPGKAPLIVDLRAGPFELARQ